MERNIEKYLPPILIVEKSGTVLDYTDSAGRFFSKAVQGSNEQINELLLPVLGTAIKEKIADLNEITQFPCHFTIQNQTNGDTWVIEIDQNATHNADTPFLVKITEKPIQKGIPQKDKKFQAIFDNTLDGIILSDLENGKAIQCNGRIIEMLETTEDGVINGKGVLNFSLNFNQVVFLLKKE